MKDLLLIDATEGMQALAEGLEGAGFHVEPCSLEAARERLSAGATVDVLVLNLLDRPSPVDVEALLRGVTPPPDAAIIAIAGSDQIAALDPASPLDDFAVHPVAFDEFLARIRRAMWRRTGPNGSDVLRRGELMLDQANYKVFISGTHVELTFKEYELLRYLALNEDKVCSREQLLSQVWGYDFYGGARTVDVHIRRLRSKIEAGTHTFVETVRNVGYRFHAS